MKKTKMLKGKLTAQNRALLVCLCRLEERLTSACNTETSDVSSRDWIPVRFSECALCQLVKTLSSAHLPKLSLCLLVCPHTCAHTEDTVMHAYICTPTNHLKCCFPFSYSTNPDHPFSAVVVFIQSRVWRMLVRVSSNFPVIHSGTTDGSSPGRLCLFWCLHNLQTPHHQDVLASSSLIRQGKASLFV